MFVFSASISLHTFTRFCTSELLSPRASFLAAGRSYSPVSLTSLSSRVMEEILLDIMLKYMEDIEVILSRHSFTKGKQCLANPVAFSYRVSASAEREEQLMASIWTSCMYVCMDFLLIWSPRTFLPLNRRHMDLMNGMLDR